MKWFRRMKEQRLRYRSLFASDDGKWVLGNLATACVFQQDPHVPGDPYTTAYNAGKQFMMLHIRTILDMSDAEMAVLVKQYEEMERIKDEDIFKHE